MINQIPLRVPFACLCCTGSNKSKTKHLIEKVFENVLVVGQVFPVCRENFCYDENDFLLKSGLNGKNERSNFQVLLPLDKCLLCT